MRIGIIQSNYLPWRGYFDFIASCDVFIFHDDIQYTKQDWRNRNLLKMPDGRLQWITVPVKQHVFDTSVDRIEIDNSNKAEWIWRHRQMLLSSLEKAPYWEDAFSLFSHLHMDPSMHRWSYLSNMNQYLIARICEYLGISTKLVDARTLARTGRKTEKILALCHAVGAKRGDIYLSGPAARQYLDDGLLARHGLGVEWKTYDYPPYPQQWGAFEGGVSILDLIANVGKRARQFMDQPMEQAA